MEASIDNYTEATTTPTYKIVIYALQYDVLVSYLLMYILKKEMIL